jgi:hypothetical protein
VSHVIDNSSLYRRLLEAMLSAETIGHGSDGVYLASSGAMKGHKLYEAMVCALAVRQVVEDAKVKEVDDHVLGEMGKALRCPKDIVRMQLDWPVGCAAVSFQSSY